MALWAAGLAGAAAAVGRWGVVGPGFLWLAGGVTALLGAVGALAGGGAGAMLGTGAALAGVVLAQRARWAGVSFRIAALAFLVPVLRQGPGSALSGALFLGGITGEMMLGHWYLIDPRLPRWALRRLAGVAGAGLALELTVVGRSGAFPWGAGQAVLGWSFLALVGLCALLLAAVWRSLRVPSYAGVMAATGLSYVAVICAFAVVVMGRLLAAPGAAAGGL
ncbi:MAG: hypothetical protein ACRDXD_10710 [Acidimicrobiia bacterium]